MATYRILKPLAAFEFKEKRAVTIPPGALIEKEELVRAVALTNVLWEDRMLSVPIQDLIECSEPIG
jgi:hypothetical protein